MIMWGLSELHPSDKPVVYPIVFLSSILRNVSVGSNFVIFLGILGI